MATVDQLETAALQWLNAKRGKLTLQRTLYLIPGFEDELGGCWSRGSHTIADVWGPRVFANWHVAVASVDPPGSPRWQYANVRVIDFDETVTRKSYLDFGDTVRDAIHSEYPNHDSSMGEYDLVCHSMGGLDAFAALVDDIDATKPVSANARIARAFNLVTMDTPYRGIPNWEIRLRMTRKGKEAQCTAMAPNSPQLQLLDAAATRLPARAVRLTCYGVDSASQVEVTSADLYADATRFAHERASLDYRFFQIPGASHSGPQGIPQSVITIANLFYTLTTGARLSVA